MKWSAVDVLVCPQRRAPLALGGVLEEEHGEIKEGWLVERASGRRYPIRDYIPRFVSDDGYASSFAVEWKIHSRTQVDRFTGTEISRRRFFASNGWDPRSLKGQRVLEVGCGAGRFSQVALEAGAELYAIDYSTAVDSCWQNNGFHPGLHLFQADVHALPFRHGEFDRIFCYGVLQHTPDPGRAFRSMLPSLKPGGEISVDVYLKSFRSYHLSPKYWIRPVTKRMSHARLYNLVRRVAPRWVPVSNRLRRVPKVGWLLNSMVPCPNYTGVLPLTPEQVVEWAILDTFDLLSPVHDHPQSERVVRSWFAEQGLELLRLDVGWNLIVATGRKRS
jgi:SAM-dependent methyltransferase